MYSIVYSTSSTLFAKQNSDVLATRDSSSNDLEWVATHFGGDLFVEGGFYGFHLRGSSSTGSGFGPGIELRIHPIFVGFSVGLCGDEGIPGLESFNNGGGGASSFTYTSIYVGAMVDSFRIEMGKIDGNNSISTVNGNPAGYTAAFLGVSRRLGGVFFFQPELKIMYPLVANYWTSSHANAVRVSQHYDVRDLYFGIGVRVGLGFN